VPGKERKQSFLTAVGMRAGRSRSAKEIMTAKLSKSQVNRGSFTLVAAMNRTISVLILAVLFLRVQAAHADSVKDALSRKYKNHIIALRSPFTPGSDQRFDSAGQPLNARSSGPWLLYGGIYVEKLNLSRDTLRLQGPLAAFADEKKDGKPVLVRFSKSQRIEILLKQPLKSLDDAEAVMGRVFFLGADAAEHAKPELRRADDTIPDDQIYDYHQDGVKAPKGVSTPPPDFSEEARKAKFQGEVTLSLVVDKAGNVARIRVDKVLGHGLDEQSMQAIKTWRFAPATRNAEPVAVREPVSVGFNLY
jgi:TonB family protein